MQKLIYLNGSVPQQGYMAVLNGATANFKIKEVWAVAWNTTSGLSNNSCSQGHAIVDVNNVVTESCQATSVAHNETHTSLAHLIDDNGDTVFDATLVMPSIAGQIIQLNINANTNPNTQHIALAVIGEDDA